jgi:hypothetical protein
MKVRGVAMVFVGLLFAAFAGAQQVVTTGPEAPEWGTNDLTVYTSHAFEFVPVDSSTTYTFDSWTKYITGGFPSLVAGVHLPSGALLEEVHVAACDEDAGTDFQMRLWECPSNPFTDPCIGVVVLSGASLSGCDWVGATSLGITIANGANTYFLEFNNYEGTGKQRIDHVELRYRLQISEAPAIPTFNDVPTDHMFFRHIEALAASGITVGCGGGDYCPDAALTRGQMAVFLAKALGLHWAP